LIDHEEVESDRTGQPKWSFSLLPETEYYVGEDFLIKKHTDTGKETGKQNKEGRKKEKKLFRRLGSTTVLPAQ
jgi:hypothetical protein